MEKNNASIKTLKTRYEIKTKNYENFIEKNENRLLITYENDFGEKIIELDGIIDIENIQILITALTELKNDFGGK